MEREKHGGGEREPRVLREIQRQFPCIMPNLQAGAHRVTSLHCGWAEQRSLARSAASQSVSAPSSSAFVVLFGTDQESPNGAQNMEVGRQPKNEPGGAGQVLVVVWSGRPRSGENIGPSIQRGGGLRLPI